MIKKRSLNIVAFTAFFVTAAITAKAEVNEEMMNMERAFQNGNGFYEKGEYQAAIGEYLKVLDAGYESAGVYYNLANAFHKTGAQAKAKINYERALRLDPGDSDIEANDRFVRANIGGPRLSKKGIWGWKPIRVYTNMVNVDQMVLVSSGFYIFALILLWIGRMKSGGKRKYVLVAVVAIVCSLGNLSIVWHEVSQIGRKAVILNEDAECFYGPFDSATVFFRLYEGMDVTVIENKDDWVKIKRDDGKSGWVKRGELEIV